MNREDDSIGNRLRKARLERGLSYDQAYADLKIHPKALEALEEDRIDPQVGEIYMKGFLKKYADFLGFDGDKLSGEYGRLHSAEEAAGSSFIEEIKQGKYMPLDIRTKFLDPVLRAAVIAAIALAVFVLFRAGAGIVRRVGKDAAPPVKKAPAAPAKKAVQAAKPKPKKKARPAKKNYIVPRSHPLALTVRTQDKVWLRVTSDDNVIFENTLAGGNAITWQARERLVLWAGRGEALDLTLNKVHLGSPGSGRIRRIIVDHEGMKVEKK